MLTWTGKETGASVILSLFKKKKKVVGNAETLTTDAKK